MQNIELFNETNLIPSTQKFYYFKKLKFNPIFIERSLFNLKFKKELKKEYQDKYEDFINLNSIPNDNIEEITSSLQKFLQDISFKLNTKNESDKKKIKKINNDDIYHFNKNLQKINLLKWKNSTDFNIKNLKEELIFTKEKLKLNNVNYYSNICNLIRLNLRTNNKDNLKINFFKNNYQDQLSIGKLLPVPVLRSRYIKDKNEISYLKDYFNENKTLWEPKKIKEISLKLKLSKKSIYKWNYDQMKKEHNN